LAREELPVFTFDRDYPSARRGFGGYLAEGPRPFRVGNWYVIGFSAGDYQAEDYGLHLMASKSLTGPYVPYLDDDTSDFTHFETEIEKSYKMYWGAARPAFFEMNGRWWVLFHGILSTDTHQLEEGERDIYLAPVDITFQPTGPPKIKISVREN
jgi:hypothetical protein